MKRISYLSLLLLFAGFFHACSPGKNDIPSPYWEQQKLGRSASIRGLSAVDEQNAWLSGSQNTIARTTDGGRTWRLLPSPGPDTLDFRDIEAFDSLRAVVMSAGPGSLSRVYRTGDGGRSWQLMLQNPDSAGFFNGIAFWNEQNGLLTGDPVDGSLVIMRTGDGGRSWQRVPAASIPPVDPMEYGFAASGSHITTAADSLAWIGTGGRTARVFRSTDRGRSWSVTSTPMISGDSSTGIFSIAFLNDQQGVAVGGDYARPTQIRDNIMSSSDGGRSWRLVEGHQVAYRSCVRKIEGRFLACGPSGSDISYDLGRTWRRIDTTAYHVIAVGDSREAVWTAGPEGIVAKIRWK